MAENRNRPARGDEREQLRREELGTDDATLRREGLHRCPDGLIRPTHPSFDCLACETFLDTEN